MRVLKEGNVDRLHKFRDRKYKITCPYCGSVLEATSADIEHLSTSKEDSCYIGCPLCTYYFKINMEPYQVPVIAEVEEIIE